MQMEKRLYKAAIEGDVSTLEALIQEDPLTLDRISLSFFHETPLHIAVLRGHLELTRAILSHKPQLASESDSLGHSPLHLASAKGYLELTRELLRVGPGACLALSKDGKLPLHLAIMRGCRVEVVRELTRTSPESTRLRVDRGGTVYHLCVKYDNLEALKVLVEELVGENEESYQLLNARDDDGNTILHFAVLYKHLEIIKYLLSNSRLGIELNAVNNSGHSALNLIENSAKDLKGLEILNFLLQFNGQRGSGNGNCYTPTNKIPTSIITQGETPTSNPWKKFLTFDTTITNQLEEIRGGLFISAAITIAITVLPMIYVELNSSNLNIVADFSMTTLPLWSALIVMLVLLSGFPLSNELCAWFVVQMMYTMLGFLGLYFFSSMSSNENHYINVGAPLILMFVWFLLLMLASLINLIRIVVWMVKIIKKGVKRRNMRARRENVLSNA